MAILIIDSCEASRHQAVTIGKWTDGRQKLEQADTAAKALDFAIRDEPQLIVIDPSMTDSDGQSLYVKLHRVAPEAVFLAYTNDRTIPLDTFDGALGKPPSKIEFLRYYQLSKKRRIERSQDKMSQHHATYKEKADNGERMPILVRLRSEPELQFSIPFLIGCSVKDALRQLGKSMVLNFEVLRSGTAISATESTRMEPMDVLVLTVELPARFASPTTTPQPAYSATLGAALNV